MCAWFVSFDLSKQVLSSSSRYQVVLERLIKTRLEVDKQKKTLDQEKERNNLGSDLRFGIWTQACQQMHINIYADQSKSSLNLQ